MLKSKNSQKGFTIVELLIVIVVIGILAALVLNTFSGVQKRARDSQRQTDVNSLATQLEVYYNDKGGYPLAAQIDSSTELQAALKGVDEGAADAPSNTTPFDLTGTASSGIGAYGYVPAGCTTANDSCTSFDLTYTKEDGGLQTKKSLNR